MMLRIVDVASIPSGTVDREQWTAIIPAAGRATRLGYTSPKILFPLLGRPILEWLVDAIEPVCSEMVLVLSPEGRAEVEPYARRYSRGRCTIVEQAAPTGMADAVSLTERAVKTKNSVVIWGDQVTLRAETISVCARAHEGRAGAMLTLPTIERRSPYVQVERDREYRIVRILQAREGEITESIGENDCGFFLFNTEALFSKLNEARSYRLGLGAKTNEFNLLPILPLFEQGAGSVVTVRIHDESETLGINTVEDARIAEAELERRGGRRDPSSSR
jgi:bifunctional UDP-N-acetylglucosamine pyrophosphorylase/glucosamine-1-phosphate N-acetyltransferase